MDALQALIGYLKLHRDFFRQYRLEHGKHFFQLCFKLFCIIGRKIVKRLHRGKKLPEQCAIEGGELIRAKGSRINIDTITGCFCDSDRVLQPGDG